VFAKILVSFGNVTGGIGFLNDRQVSRDWALCRLL
jgi:hypothetical protein